MPGLAWRFVRLFYTVLGPLECAGWVRHTSKKRHKHLLNPSTCHMDTVDIGYSDIGYSDILDIVILLSLGMNPRLHETHP